MVSGVVGGVDTHADVHVAAALDANGGVLGIESFGVDAAGYRSLSGWLLGFGPVGQPIDLRVSRPNEGAIIGVVGVSHDAVLNVRSGPSSSFDVIAALESTQMGITGSGEGWQLPSGSVWWRIEAGGVEGSANQRYLSRLGGVDDLTSLVVSMLGEVPSAETMTDPGATIAAAFGDVNHASNVVVSVARTQGDLGEVTYDVNGLSDDSVGGYRIHIFGRPTDGRGFSLMTVEATVMRLRGVRGDLCV